MSSGYERRLGFAARVGTALHRVLQSYSEYPLPAGSAEATAEEVKRRFQQELAAQQEVAAGRPRERGLPSDQTRVQRSLEAALAEGFRVAAMGPATQAHRHVPGQPAPDLFSGVTAGRQLPSVEAEVPVQSNDGFFHGRIDRAEHRDDGTWLFDYKSALRDDLPGRYRRQLQLYALMWYDTRASWPIAAQVVYPLTGTIHSVAVEPEICRRVASEAVDLLTRLHAEPHAHRLAEPGDTCKICDFRPWCQAFWRWQAAEVVQGVALDRASLGFEGRILDIQIAEQYWTVHIVWRSAVVSLRAPQERFPQLTRALPNMHVRVLDTALRGLRHQPQAIISPQSELFLVL